LANKDRWGTCLCGEHGHICGAATASALHNGIGVAAYVEVGIQPNNDIFD
jgi:hypothetical protein